ncbi:MAG: tetratricopeptide repeat protein [Leptolyngbyaceae cyanobacterium]
MFSKSPLPTQDALRAELDLLNLSIRSIQPPRRRTHYQAVLNWLTRYQVPSEASALQQVRGLLESFQHLYAVEDLRRASQILTIRLHTETNDELHNQLHTWGYCQAQIELYNKLLGRLDAQCDSIFLNGLGLVHRSLGNYEAARLAYERSLALAMQTQDTEGGKTALCNLGEIHCLSQDYPKAIDYTQQAFHLAQRLNDVSTLGTVLGNLGLIYQSMGDYRNAVECHQRYLQISQRLNDCVAAMNALIGLGIAHHELGQYSEAINFHQQSLKIALDIGDRFSQGTALGNLAVAYQFWLSQKGLLNMRKNI